MSRIDIPVRHVVLTLVVLLAVSPFAAYAMPGLIGADESYIVLTGSMRPAYVPGDVVFVTATPTAAIGVGDVITFERGAGPTTTHRVIDVVDASGEIAFQTKGDNNEDADPALVRADQVVGVVTFSVPYIGTVITAADTQYGFLALVVVPFALLLLDVGYGALLARRRDTDAVAAETGADADGTANVTPAADGGVTVGAAGTLGAGAADDDLPALYDPAAAARSYYEHATAAQAVESTTLSGRDMLASIAVAAVLLVYAAWNAYWQFQTFGQPRAETMSVVSGALVGIAFLVYLRYTAGTETPATPAVAPGAPPVGQPFEEPRYSGVPFGMAPWGAVREEEVADAD